MTDATLALIGITLAVGTSAGWWARGRWQRSNPTRQEKLARRVYRHLDDIIGATKAENQLRADKRFRCEHKRLHVSQRAWRRGLARRPQRRVGRSDHVARGHLRELPAERRPGQAGRRSVGDRGVLAQHRDPRSRPVEALRVTDRHQPQPALGEPVAPNRPRLGVLRGRDGHAVGFRVAGDGTVLERLA